MDTGRARKARVAASVITPLGVAVPSFVHSVQEHWRNAEFPRLASAVPHSRKNGKCPLSSAGGAPSHAYGLEDFSDTKTVGAARMNEREPLDAVHHYSKSFIDQEMWFTTNDGQQITVGGNKTTTWVEAGWNKGQGTYGGRNQFYEGPFWARQNSENFVSFKFSTLKSTIASTSWYDFSVRALSTTQADFEVTAKVFSQHGHTSSKYSPTYHQPHTKKAHSISVGIEATCSYGVSHNSSTFALKNGASTQQMVSGKSSWTNWGSYRSPGNRAMPHGGLYDNSNHTGAVLTAKGKPFTLSWYSTGRTGNKFNITMASKW